MATKAAAKPRTTPPRATKAAAKPAASVTAAEPVADSESALVLHLRVKGLVDRVVAATEQNRKDVKQSVEAVLDEIAKALLAGESLILPPLGRIRVAKKSGDDTGVSMTLKLRKVGEKPAVKTGEKEGLAEVGEAG